MQILNVVLIRENLCRKALWRPRDTLGAAAAEDEEDKVVEEQRSVVVKTPLLPPS